jgi:hypothetical protein
MMAVEDTTRMPNNSWGGGNDAYLDKTLRYRDIELSLDESVSWRVLGHLWLRAFIASALVWSVFFVISIIVGLGSLGGSDPNAAYNGGSTGASLSGGLGAFGGLLSVGGLIAFVVFWVVLLLSKLPEPIAEWRVLLADHATKADAVYSQISGTLRNRQLPVSGRLRRIRVGFGPANISNRLVLAERSYTAYVSVFPYGTSLYLGWMVWRSRRGTTLVRQFVVDLFQGMAGRRDPERLMLRTERARAMREAVHAACREGLVVAVEDRDVPLAFGFPEGLPPVEDDQYGSAPIPAGFPVQPGHAGGPRHP